MTDRHPLRAVAALVVLAAALVLAMPAAAQIVPWNGGAASADNARLTEDGQPDYDQWDTVSQRARNVLAGEHADNAVLEALRVDLVSWRRVFEAAQGLNTPRRESLQAQIDALGPVPAEGDPPEPMDTSALRADLTAQLAEARAPAVRAAAALQSAESLIAEVDRTIASRQSDALRQAGPSPVNPANWPAAGTALSAYGQALAAELSRTVLAGQALTTLRANAPLVGLLVIGGLFLTFRSGRWIDRVARRNADRAPGSPAARLALFGLTLAQAILPVAGIAAIAEGLLLSGIVGLRGQVIVDAVPPVAVAAYLGIWIGRQVFPERDDAHLPLALDEAQRRRGQRAALGLGLFIGLEGLASSIGAAEQWGAAEMAVFLFPFLVIADLFLIRVGQLLLVHAGQRSDATGEEGATRAVPVFKITGRALMVLAVVSALLGAAGYANAADRFVFPVITSLGLVAIIGILQRLVTDLYGALTGQRERLDEALAPTLIGFLLIVLSLPGFALIWGVRPAQLIDMWAAFLSGFDLGGMRLSPADFLTFAVVFAALYTAVRLLQGTLKSSVLPKTRMDIGAQTALVAGIGYLGIFLAAVIAITAAGIDLSSLAIVAGALSVGIGFGLQTIVSNFVSGIILLIERPIKEGDWIEVGTTMGYVRRISVRSTRIETFDRTDVIVPNQDLIAGPVTNYTHSNDVGRLIVPIGVAYGTDTRRLEAILHEIAESHPMVMLDPPPMIVFAGFGASSLDFEVRVILRDVNFTLGVKTELNHKIAERFAAEGITIPFPQQDLWLKNPEALRAPATPDPAA